MALFGFDKKNITQGAFDTIIGDRARFKGELDASGSVFISGEFEGKLNTSGEIIVADGSKITGNIHGGSVVVSGVVDGDISATHSLEITKTGRVHGGLVGGRIVIQEGSQYTGRVNVESQERAVAEELPVQIKEENEDSEETIIIQETDQVIPNAETVRASMF
ncbi:hypothetical protein A2291_03540 [candidate division WOR-1 bacterium RIFOXYB2_FULL_42_35]|uniref:Cell shape determination protein CcmA n=1 Tax=candidate division WOR-1 bacterium RIFOXYC2_FULL_41_25 TaxID=1802586 RepID=A0A1F4TQV3_UNCSA|nr:MAG: hypothetical protein A2247_03110 [candidate division WOR-1 bacterium RIFOXYA2_FULL_41_14]OGC25537.1 MAG: hypothetical protein A2291_03540 [candidate division WOR-1 bacterium RIFOXYB2_FULL_42_35]OGC34969.1 MAG: hypothetical protein A2462_05170 [candidate division WOR-1 bacterium RIFOXYC2_FULL_41_25]OGC41518.1 MAG: hypothetical protein A2548_01415 [candidate division WOR-1 bacterium RIFOXYD2_FULL_41_8]